MTVGVGSQLAGYRLDAVVGQGGGGVVYRATHLHLQRVVAVKVLADVHAVDHAFRRRFAREARVAASLDHPNIVPVYDAGDVDGQLYLVMRFIDGRNLADLIADTGPLSLARTCVLLEQVAAALDAAHAAGLVHRDVKPGNVLVADNRQGGHAYLSDFGLTSSTATSTVTNHAITGTLAYMAPERFRPGTVPHPSFDVYGLGCTAYTCLQGSPPFDRDSLAEMLAAHVSEPPPPLSRKDPRLPPAVDAVLARAIAKDPDTRHSTCGEFVAALRDTDRWAVPTPPPDNELGRLSTIHPASGAGWAPVPAAPPPGPPTGPMPTPMPGPSPLPQPPTASRHRRARIAIAVLAALVVASAVVVAVTFRQAARDPVPAQIPLSSTTLAMAIDRAGNLYFSTFDEHRIRRLTPGGVVEPVTGTGIAGFSGDGGPAAAAQVYNPEGLAVGADGTLYIADTYNNRVRAIGSDGVIRTISGNGRAVSAGDGAPAGSAQLNLPSDVTLGPDGSIYIAEVGGDRVRRIDTTGTISTVAGDGTGTYDGEDLPAVEAGLTYVDSIAVAADGSLYLTDTESRRVRRVGPDGRIRTIAGDGDKGIDGLGGPAIQTSVRPWSVALGPDGDVYFSQDHQVVRIDESGLLRLVAGGLLAGGSGDGGAATLAGLSGADSLAFAPDGSLYVGDNYNRRIRRIAPDGTISTVIGAGAWYPLDGGPATLSHLRSPTFAALDPTRRMLYIADSGNNRIRRIDLVDGTIVTVAGTGERGFAGDGGPATAATLNWPLGIAVDAHGVLFVADCNNNRVRRIDVDGTISSVAGTGAPSYSADGAPATSTALQVPTDVLLDADGSLLIVEQTSNRVRRVGPDGLVSTVAGTNAFGTGGGFGGDGGPATRAQLDHPFAIERAPDGALLISDIQNERLRRVSPDGTMSTFATGLTTPNQITIDPQGRILVADQAAHRVFRLGRDGTLEPVAGTGAAPTTLRVEKGTALTVPLNQPTGVLALATGEVVVVDQSKAVVYLIDPATGEMRHLAGATF
ncbi:serine/threonine-protein kinase [Actinomycetes bacterium KLBMP 9759]